MIEQYKKEMSEIHAPADLIERTREAVKKKEEKLQAESRNQKTKKVIRKRRIGWTIVPMAVAAAVLLLVAVPYVLKGAAAQEDTSVLLGQENSSDIQKIENKAGTEMKMTEMSEIPEEFGNAEEITRGNYTYFLIEEMNGTGFKAYVEKEGKGYFITGAAKDEEHFLQEAEKLILEK